MSEPGRPPRPYRVDTLPAASERINALMASLREAVLEQQTLRQRLYQVEFQSSLAGDALLTLVYHRALDADWERCAAELQQRLGAAIVGRSRRQRLVVGRDYVDESLEVDGRRFWYRQPEGGFTQPNAAMNCRMLGWAREVAAARQDRDLLELYCGNGNFTVVLADRFRRVLATEIAKVSVAAARHNLAANGIDNVDLVRLSSAEVASALAGERRFRRLQDVDLEALHFSTAFVDPPRAGLDPDTIELLRRFPRILYISCNPHTLRANIEELGARYRITRFAMFDQFPFTPHTECGVLLEAADGQDL